MNYLESNQAIDFAQHDQIRFFLPWNCRICYIMVKCWFFQFHLGKIKHKTQILCLNVLRLSYLTLQWQRVEELTHFIPAVQLRLWKMSLSKLSLFLCKVKMGCLNHRWALQTKRQLYKLLPLFFFITNPHPRFCMFIIFSWPEGWRNHKFISASWLSSHSRVM